VSRISEDRARFETHMRDMDFNGGQVETEPRQVQIVFSARMPHEWTPEIMAEMERRGLKNPSQLIKALVREGLDRAAAGDVHTPAITEALGHLDAVRRTLIEAEQQAA
jgi:hypothetical protein